MPNTIFILNKNDVYIQGLRRASDGVYINNATFTFTAYDETGAAIDGATNIPMTYQAASNGHYRGSIADSAELTVGSDVRIRALGTLPDGSRVTFEKTFTVAMRGAT